MLAFFRSVGALALVLGMPASPCRAVTLVGGDVLLVEFNFVSIPAPNAQLLISYTGPLVAPDVCATGACFVGSTYINGSPRGGFGVNRYGDPPSENIVGSVATGDVFSAFDVITVIGGSWELNGFTLYGNCNGVCIGDRVPATLTVNPNPTQLSLIYGVPEPSTWAMALIGFAYVVFAGYRRRNRFSFA